MKVATLQGVPTAFFKIAYLHLKIRLQPGVIALLHPSPLPTENPCEPPLEP